MCIRDRGLRTLSIIKTCLDNIKKSKHIVLNENEIPLDDEETFKLLTRGDTTGPVSYTHLVISQVVPKCIASGYQTRALQLLNMADNRLLNFVGKHLYSIDDTIVDWGNSPRICYSWFKRNYYRACLLYTSTLAPSHDTGVSLSNGEYRIVAANTESNNIMDILDRNKSTNNTDILEYKIFVGTANLSGGLYKVVYRPCVPKPKPKPQTPITIDGLFNRYNYPIFR